MTAKKKIRKCSVRGCAEKLRAKGMCSPHYQKAYDAAHKEEKKAYDSAYYEAHKEEKKAYDSAYREAHKEERKAYREAYGRTFEGMIHTMYAGMRSRVKGFPTQLEKNRRSYDGRHLPGKEEFLRHARHSVKLYELWKTWSLSAYDTELKPSPDRTFTSAAAGRAAGKPSNFTGGYELDNFTFITWKENRDLALRKRLLNNSKAVYAVVGKQLAVEGRNSVTRACRPKQKQAIYDAVGVSRRKHGNKKSNKA